MIYHREITSKKDFQKLAGIQAHVVDKSCVDVGTSVSFYVIYDWRTVLTRWPITAIV